MDIKTKIEQITKKLLSDKDLMQRWEKNPTAVVESLLGIDLPDDLVKQIIDGIEAKLKLDKVGDVLNGLGSLFGKK